MKTTVKEEGLNLSTRHDFGNPDHYFNEFKFVVSFFMRTQLGDIEEEVYHYITSDNYIQVCNKTEYHEPTLIAQFKRKDNSLKSQLKDILKLYIKNARFFIGFPSKAAKGGIFTSVEFASILEEIKNEFEKNKKEALKNPPELTAIFEGYGLQPRPNENGGNQWLANCPRCQKFYIVFWNNSLRWGCGYCSLHGEGKEEFRTAMKMVKDPTEENKREYEINLQVGKLKSLKTAQERIDEIARDIQSGELKYKDASEKDYNLVFELLYGCKLEEVEPEIEISEVDIYDIIEDHSYMNKNDIRKQVKKVCSRFLSKEKLDDLSKAIKKDDFDLSWELTKEQIEQYVQEYNELYYDEIYKDRMDSGSYWYTTYVTLKSSDGYTLYYQLGWTEGAPETGCATTPYSRIK